MKKRLTTLVSALTLILSPFVSSAASVSPSVLELSSVRGDLVESTFEILNTGASEQTYFLDLLSFIPDDESGSPQFISKDQAFDGLVSWITFPVTEVVVPPQSRVEVPFDVVVPDDVASGGYYAAITVSTAPTEIIATNGAIIEAKTAVLVLLTIEGETVEQIELLDFSLDQLDSALPFGTFTFRLQNQGNVHVSPVGEIQLTGLFGQTISVLDANEAKGRVLPSSTRVYSVVSEIEGLSWFEAAGYQLSYMAMGPITAELDLRYADEGVLNSKVTFWVIPWQLLSLLLAGILILGLGTKKLSQITK
jgi:hypothetical protein